MLTAERPQTATGLDSGKVPGLPPLDLVRFAAALADLEFYVDGLLEGLNPIKMDPAADDEVLDARLACL